MNEIYRDIPKLKVYFASKLDNASQVLSLSLKLNVECMSRWVEYVGKIPDTGEFATWFWLVDESCVQDADVIVVFANKGQHLRGALVEAGMAIALNKPICVLGEHPDYGTWQYHPMVARYKDLEELAIGLSQYRAIIYRNLITTGEDKRQAIWKLLCQSLKQTS